MLSVDYQQKTAQQQTVEKDLTDHLSHPTVHVSLVIDFIHIVHCYKQYENNINNRKYYCRIICASVQKQFSLYNSHTGRRFCNLTRSLA